MNCRPTLLPDVFANIAALRRTLIVVVGIGLVATGVGGAAATPGDTLYVQIEGVGVRQAPLDSVEKPLLASLFSTTARCRRHAKFASARYSRRRRA